MNWLLWLLRRCDCCFWRRRRLTTRNGLHVCVRCAWLAAIIAGLTDRQLEEWKKMLEGP